MLLPPIMGSKDLVTKPIQSFGPEFRNNLKGLEAVAALKELNNENAVEEFISQGGDILDVVSVIQSVNQSDVPVVLAALTHIVRRYLTTASAEDTTHCEEACHTLLTVHASRIQKTFDEDKVSVLRLFAVIVQVSFHIAKTVLLSFEKCLIIGKKDHFARKDYIDLVDALLNDENIFITRTLLEKGVLNKVIAGLIYDKYASILTLLNTISDKVVSNVAINKSLKMKVFNTATLNFLFALYHWRGAPEQCELVRSTVHALLIQLCTDYKKGVVYFDETYGTSNLRGNPLILNFLRKIDTPWMNDLSADLVIKVLHSCPDLVKPILDSYKSSFEPRASNNFYQLCSFLSVFISSFDIMEKLSNGDLLMNIIKQKLFPASILEIIKTGTPIKNDIQIRNACYHLYVTILNKLDKISSIVKAKFPDKLQSIFEYLQSELPDLPMLLKTWKVDSENDKVEYLVQLADVVLKHCKLFPLNFIPDRAVNLLEDNIIANPVLYVKALQINALLFEPSIDSIDFQKGLTFILTHPVDNFSQVFHMLLKSTHLFDEFEQELEIWYHAISNVEPSKRTEVGAAFVSALKNMSKMMSCLDCGEDSTVMSTELLPDDADQMSFTPIPNMTTCLPSLLQHCQSQEEIEPFIHEVTISLFHMQICPKSFYATIKSFLTLPKSKTSLAHYMKSWSKNSMVPMPKNSSEESSLETELSAILLNKDEIHLQTLLNKLSSKKNRNKRLVSCARLALFYATQCAEQEADQEITSICIEAFIKLSEITTTREKEIVIKEAFENPIVTKDFIKDVMVLCNLLVYLIDNSKDQKYVSSYRKFIFPKLKKMLKDSSTKFESSALLSLTFRLGLDVSDAQAFVKLMLNEDPCTFYKKKKLTFWGKLLRYCIGDVKPELCEETLNKLETLLVHLSSTGVDTTSIEECLVKYIYHYPQCVQYLNIDNLLDKISSPLTVALIAINPDLVSHLPKPRLLINALPIVQAILKYAPLIGDKYLGRVYKLAEKSLLEMILSDEGLDGLSLYIAELGQVFDKFAVVQNIEKICEHINSRTNLTLHSNNCALLVMLYLKAQDPDSLFIKLIKVFVDLPPEERSHAKWIHEALESTVTQTSGLSFAPSSPWHELAKFCLKDCMSNENVLSLQTLTSLCKVLPAEKCHHNIFKMIISHSKFVESMLSESSLKSSLVHILNVLIKGGQVPLAPSHVPLFLSAYNATLSHTDQYLFEILQHYEAQDIDIHEYKPFLWGSAAATYYSVSDTIMSKTLNRQPHPSQVTTLLLELYVKRTVTEFPMERQLIPTGLSEDALKKYDPSFLLPLFIFLLLPESPVLLNKFINSGALAISLASLSSNDPNIRKSAYMVLVRFQSHLAGSKYNEQAGLVAHFIDVLRNGVSQLIDDNEQNTSPQLSSIVSIFLARASLIVSNPSHELYAILHKYFIAKPALDLTRVPEFLVLFQSDNEYNREWILTIIRDGLNTLQDWVLCDRTVIFKILFTFFTSSLCSRNIQRLICDIINKCLCIDKGRYYLINNQGLLSWLKDVPHPISILETLSNHQKSDPNGFLQTLLLHRLFQSNSQEETEQVLTCVLEFLQSNSADNTALLFNNLEDIMEFAEDQFGTELVRESKNILQHSWKYVIPLDEMSTLTKITYLLTSLKRK